MAIVIQQADGSYAQLSATHPLPTAGGGGGGALEFWSQYDDAITLPAVAANIDLPNVVVAGLTATQIPSRVIVMVKCRVIENTSGAGTNAFNGAQAIRIKISTGAWGADDITAINITDNQWLVPAAIREMGDVMEGDVDVSTVVTGNGTYNLRFALALVDLASLVLSDVQVGFKIWL